MVCMLTKRRPLTVFSRIGAAAAICWLATAVHATSAEEIRAETDRIAAQYSAAMAHCQTLQGNSQDICEEDAKGSERVARAERDAKLLGDADHNYQVRVAHADADYHVAKERCNDMRGDAINICKKDAKAAHQKAQEDARIKRVEAPPATSSDEKMAPLAPAPSTAYPSSPSR